MLSLLGIEEVELAILLQIRLLFYYWGVDPDGQALAH
jgi:hypothetical protein